MLGAYGAGGEEGNTQHQRGPEAAWKASPPSLRRLLIPGVFYQSGRLESRVQSWEARGVGVTARISMLTSTYEDSLGLEKYKACFFSKPHI